MRAMLMSLAALAACSQTTPRTPAEPPAPQTAEEATAQDACGASRYRRLIGTPAAQIDQSTLPPRTRIITPDMMVTQDFSPERLNIMVGTDGLVGSLSCF